MKKTLMMMAIAATCITVPAYAMSDSDMNSKMMVEHCMKMADTDGDGMVSKKEMMAYSEKMFMDSDMNKDGMISMDEMMTAHKKDMMMMNKDGAMMKKDGMMNK